MVMLEVISHCVCVCVPLLTKAITKFLKTFLPKIPNRIAMLMAYYNVKPFKRFAQSGKDLQTAPINSHAVSGTWLLASVSNCTLPPKRTKNGPLVYIKYIDVNLYGEIGDR